jgi:hypothetical protein
MLVLVELITKISMVSGITGNYIEKCKQSYSCNILCDKAVGFITVVDVIFQRPFPSLGAFINTFQVTMGLFRSM